MNSKVTGSMGRMVWMGLMFTGAWWGRASEPLASGMVQGNGIDLQGYEIESIGFRLDSFDLRSPGEDPNGDGIWTEMDWSGTLFVYAVPEPGPAFLLIVAGLAGWLQPRRRRIP